ncbi:MAG: META domain-containing protein [Alphaproteobacteria bacterium]|nr:META domain-containing protein [Alphaproteobacteria bacterium]
MKKILSLLAGICLLAGCSSAGEQISLAGKKFVLQNSEADTTVTLEFADSGNDYYGQVVNNYFGSYKIFNDKITFSAGGTTRMMGPREEMEAEGRYFADLDKVRNFTLQNDILTLITSDGKALTFEEKF